MNTQAPQPERDDPANERLRASRERLRQALAPHDAQARTSESGAADDPMETTEWMHSVAKPAAEALVRRYPARSLAAAAATGALLVRLRPWQGLIGSILVSALVRKGGTALAAWATEQAADALSPRPGDGDAATPNRAPRS